MYKAGRLTSFCYHTFHCLYHFCYHPIITLFHHSQWSSHINHYCSYQFSYMYIHSVYLSWFVIISNFVMDRQHVCSSSHSQYAVTIESTINITHIYIVSVITLKSSFTIARVSFPKWIYLSWFYIPLSFCYHSYPSFLLTISHNFRHCQSYVNWKISEDNLRENITYLTNHF